jgi:hypothetical protein
MITSNLSKWLFKKNQNKSVETIPLQEKNKENKFSWINYDNNMNAHAKILLQPKIFLK